MRLFTPTLRSLLAAITGSHTVESPVRRRKPATSKVPIECLEPRQFLSATQLVFGSVPASGFLGSTLGEIVVDIKDAGGNVVTNDNSKVTLTLHSGPTGGKVMGKFTVNAVAGVATFENLKPNMLGTYTFTAADAVDSLTSVASSNVVVQAPPVPTSLVVSQPANNTAGATTSTVTVTILDQYSHSFTTGHAMISLALVNPTTGAKLLGKLSESAINGVATFTGLSLNEAGTFELRASEGSGSHALAMTTQTFTVTSPAVATKLIFGQDANNVAAGAIMGPTVTVKVEDQYGNVVTTDHSTIKLATLAGAPQSKTFTAHVVNGVASFPTISFEQAGSYQLHATDGSLIAKDSSTITVSAAAADHLVFTQIPATNTAHAGPFTVKADVVDRFGNTVTTNTSTLTLGLASGPTGATLHLTSPAVAGVVTFAGVTFTAAGHYRLAVSGVGVKPATSATFILT